MILVFLIYSQTVINIRVPTSGERPEHFASQDCYRTGSYEYGEAARNGHISYTAMESIRRQEAVRRQIWYSNT